MLTKKLSYSVTGIAVCVFLLCFSIRAFANTAGNSLFIPFQVYGKTLDVNGRFTKSSVPTISTKPVAGVVGNALSFDGVKNQAAMIYSPFLDGIHQELTVSLWVKPALIQMEDSEKQNAQTLISKSWNWNLRIQQQHFKILFYGTKKNFALIAPMSPEANRWYHVAYTFSESQHIACLYIDGKMVYQRSGIDCPLQSVSGSPLLIGMDPHDWNQYHGAVDELHIYDRALSAGELESLFSKEGKALFQNAASRWQKQLASEQGIINDVALKTQFNAAKSTLQKLQDHPTANNFWQTQTVISEFQRAVSGYKYNRALAKEAGKQGVSHAVVFVVRPFSGTPILPESSIDASATSGTISLTGTPSEVLTGSFVLNPDRDVQDVMIQSTSLRSAKGNAVIPADAVDLRIVKTWFQAGTAWKDFHDYSQVKTHILVPELLLHDASLVKVNTREKLNYVKLAGEGKDEYADVNSQKVTMLPGTLHEGAARFDYPVSEFPVGDDAATLQPLNIKKGQNQQFWLNVKIPDNARAGIYTSKLVVKSESGVSGYFTLKIRVLPFNLPAPVTRYNPQNRFTFAVYYRGRLSTDGKGYIGSVYKSVAQYTAEMHDLRNHGMDFMPVKDSLLNEKQLNTTLSIHREIFGSDTLYYTGIEGNLGNFFQTSDSALATLKERILQLKALALKHGYTHILTYGIDETTSDKIEKERIVWNFMHQFDVGAYVAGQKDIAGMMGDILHVLVSGGPLSADAARQMHSHGHRIFSYGNPQSGVENPRLYRVNYGIKLWQHNYDGAMTYAYQGHYGTIWNDFDGPFDEYRDEVFAYPTSHGVVDTMAWEGYAQAKRDVEYVSYLNQLIRRRKSSNDIRKKETVQEADKYMNNLSVDRNTNLNAVRDKIIQYILKLD